jgi:hypothetical protein
MNYIIAYILSSHPQIRLLPSHWFLQKKKIGRRKNVKKCICIYIFLYRYCCIIYIIVAFTLALALFESQSWSCLVLEVSIVSVCSCLQIRDVIVSDVVKKNLVWSTVLPTLTWLTVALYLACLPSLFLYLKSWNSLKSPKVCFIVASDTPRKVYFVKNMISLSGLCCL